MIGVPLDLPAQVFEGLEAPIPSQTVQKMDLDPRAVQLAFRKGK
jgi:hypothetical protein